MLSALTMTMLMFNLLVAIFTDLYDEIKENERAIELRLMNDAIVDVEFYIQFFYSAFSGDTLLKCFKCCFCCLKC